MVSEQMEKLVLEKTKQLIPLLRYIQDNQDEKIGVYKEMIANYMRSEKLCSRLTTLDMINTLLEEHVLLQEKVMNYQVRLEINPEYNFSNLFSQIVESQIKKLEPLTQFAKTNTKKHEFKIKMTKENITSSLKPFGKDTRKQKVKPTAKINTV